MHAYKLSIKAISSELTVGFYYIVTLVSGKKNIKVL